MTLSWYALATSLIFIPWIWPLSRICLTLWVFYSLGKFYFQWVCGVQHVPSDARVHHWVWTQSVTSWCTSPSLFPPHCRTYPFLLCLPLCCNSLCPSMSRLWPAVWVHLLPVLLNKTTNQFIWSPLWQSTLPWSKNAFKSYKLKSW